MIQDVACRGDLRDNGARGAMRRSGRLSSWMIAALWPRAALAEGWCLMHSACPDSFSFSVMTLVAAILAVPAALVGAALLWRQRRPEDAAARRRFRVVVGGNFLYALLAAYAAAIVYWMARGRDNFALFRLEALLTLPLAVCVLQLGYFSAARWLLRSLHRQT